jgi:hypothetical protein
LYQWTDAEHGEVLGQKTSRRGAGKEEGELTSLGAAATRYSGEVGSAAVLRRLVLHRRGRRVLAALIPRSGALHQRPCSNLPSASSTLPSTRSPGQGKGKRPAAGISPLERAEPRTAAARGRQDARNTTGGTDCKKFQTSKAFSVNFN